VAVVWPVHFALRCAFSPSIQAESVTLMSGHIVFVTGEYPPMPGGVGAYTAELAAALVALGWRVSVLAGTQAAPTGATPPLPYHPAQDGVEVYPVIPHWRWGCGAQVQAWANRVDADWLHVQYQGAAFDGHPAILLAMDGWQRAGYRVAWTYHDMLVIKLFPKAPARLRRWMVDRAARRCDLTITTNEGDRRHLAVGARRLALVPIGSNIRGRRYTPEQRRAQRSLRGYSDKDVVIGYFGFLVPSKGALVLVETLARLVHHLPTVKLLMIGEAVGSGDTNQPYLQQVQAAVARFGVGERVQWTGQEPDAMVSADLNACDLLLMPYLDGASTRRGTLMAGLAQGCALVTTTPTVPIPELVDGRELLYVPPGDVEATVGAVLRLVRTPGLIATLGQNARQAAAAFTWEGIAEAHGRLYLGG
jgi:glycosyltransferase involved in cell wall biosynthesis